MPSTQNSRLSEGQGCHLLQIDTPYDTKIRPVHASWQRLCRAAHENIPIRQWFSWNFPSAPSSDENNIESHLLLNIWNVPAKFGGVPLSLTNAFLGDSDKNRGRGASTAGGKWHDVGRKCPPPPCRSDAPALAIDAMCISRTSEGVQIGNEQEIEGYL